MRVKMGIQERLMFRSAMIGSLLVFVLWAPRVISQSSQTEAPAVQRAKELAQLINTDDRVKFREYAQHNFAPVMLNLPMDMHLTVLSSLYDRTRGVEFVAVQKASPSSVVALMRIN
jgi:hypothetical protein